MKLKFIAQPLFLLLPALWLPLLSGQPDGLSADEFLTEIRRPLSQDVWGEITGRITHAPSGKAQIAGGLRVRITFSSGALHAQLVLNEQNVYGFEQKHLPGEPVSTSLSKPDNDIALGLFDFGLELEDLTFSFLYWDFLEELPRQKNCMRNCRVMKLAHPDGQGLVQVWFDTELGFPLEVWWFKTGENSPWRKLLMKGAKKHDNGLWFVREMRLDGNNWKTRVIFDFASLNEIGSK